MSEKYDSIYWANDNLIIEIISTCCRKITTCYVTISIVQWKTAWIISLLYMYNVALPQKYLTIEGVCSFTLYGICLTIQALQNQFCFRKRDWIYLYEYCVKYFLFTLLCIGPGICIQLYITFITHEKSE